MIILRSSSNDLIYAHIYIRTFSRVCSKKEDGCVIDTDLCYISMLHTMYSSGHTYTSGTHKTQTRPQAFILTYIYYYTNIYYTHIEQTDKCIYKQRHKAHKHRHTNMQADKKRIDINMETENNDVLRNVHRLCRAYQ